MKPPRHRSVRRWGVADRDQEGRRVCRWCRASIEHLHGRRTFCSDACVHEWKIRSRAGYARSQVLKRDHGVCALCGSDAQWFKNVLRHAEFMHLREPFGTYDRNSALNRAKRRLLCAASWQADHIRPVAEGGGCCGLDNLRTLCGPCHARETGALRRRLNAYKRGTDPPLFTAPR